MRLPDGPAITYQAYSGEKNMNFTPEVKAHIKKGRANFLAMAVTYFLGAFNDNYFKQAAMLLAVAAGQSGLQGTATILFSLPFIIFSAWGGWLADRFAKRHVVIGAKWLELCAMLVGAYGLYSLNWGCILAMVFLMALQSTLFGPALNGSIPELYPEEYVPTANAFIKMASTAAILLGIALSGISLDQHWYATEVEFGRLLVAAGALFVAGMGILASFGVPKRKPAGTQARFPWLGPIHSMRDVWQLRHDRLLLLAVLADGFFYFVASAALLVINTLGLIEFGLSQTVTGLLSVSLMVGVCCGSILAAKLTRSGKRRWYSLLAPAALVMGVGMIMTWSSSLMPESIRLYCGFVSLFLAGTAGGVFLIPVTSFIQIRPRPEEKGRIIAASSFVSFTAILGAGQLYSLVHEVFKPTTSFLLLGILTMVVAVGIGMVVSCVNRKENDTCPLMKAVVRLGVIVIRFLLRCRYRVTVKGLENVKKINDGRGTLFLPNHPALIDPVIVGSILYDTFSPRPLSDQGQANKPFVRHILKAMNVIEIPDLGVNGRQGRRQAVLALQAVAGALNNGENVVFYPAGRIYRSRFESLGGNSGVSTIAKKAKDARVVLVRTKGLWGSSFGRGNGEAPGLFADLRANVLRVLASFVFFMPKRPVSVEFVEVDDFPRQADKLEINEYLERFYNEQEEFRSHVPYYWWQGRGARQLDEAESECSLPDTSTIDIDIKNKVSARIVELAGVELVAEEDRLMADLGLDSLTVLELASWVEDEYGVRLDQTDDLESVAHWQAAAAGQMSFAGHDAKRKIPATWFGGSEDKSLNFPGADTIAHAFLRQAMTQPHKHIVADRRSGVKTYRDLLIAVFALKPLVEKMAGNRVGIMLPASVGSVVAWLAVMFSGKTPVMVNWTVGQANMVHCLKTAEVRHVISAGELVKRLGRYGVDPDDLAVDWHLLEMMGAGVSKFQKLWAFFQAKFGVNKLKSTKISESAVVLFTSGSEAAPKSVPLSHKNILTNVRDFAAMVDFRESDKLLGMLPPFHSLGFSGTLVMPLCMGLPTAYHADPTQGAALAGMMRDYQSTMTVATPSFLKNMMRASENGDLDSLRLVFSGAEKCPADVYERFNEVCPQGVLCEGYGITECSPVVSLNDPSCPRPGVIGKLMGSMECLLIHPETGEALAPGEQGLLLVCGDNIFNGYIDEDVKSPFVESHGKTWYNTGDLVAIEDGVLEFRGRIKRFVKLAGEMISLPAVENVLLQHFAGRVDSGDGPALAVEATADEENPQIVLFTTLEISRDQANRVIREAGLSALHWVKQIKAVEAIPVLGTGKTDYKMLKGLV